MIKLGWLTTEPIFFNDAANIDADSRITEYKIVSSFQGNEFEKKKIAMTFFRDKFKFLAILQHRVAWMIIASVVSLKIN